MFDSFGIKSEEQPVTLSFGDRLEVGREMQINSYNQQKIQITGGEIDVAGNITFSGDPGSSVTFNGDLRAGEISLAELDFTVLGDLYVDGLFEAFSNGDSAGSIFVTGKTNAGDMVLTSMNLEAFGSVGIQTNLDVFSYFQPVSYTVHSPVNVGNNASFLSESSGEISVNTAGLIVGGNKLLTGNVEEDTIPVKLISGEPTSGALFGTSVAVGGNLLAIGGYNGRYDYYDYPYPSGMVQVFSMETNAWKKTVTLKLNSKGYDGFGESVAVSGDKILVGAADESAYLFQMELGAWNRKARLVTSDTTAKQFGRSVAIDGNYAVIGAPYTNHSGSYSGTAYVFKWDGNDWIEQTKLVAGDGGTYDAFGHAVDISGDYVVIGSADHKNGDAGAVYVYKREGELWNQQVKLTSDDRADSDFFGCSGDIGYKAVSINGDYIAAGASGNDDHGELSGSAYIFKREGDVWSQQVKLTVNGASEGDRFGNSVSIADDYVVIGAPGKEIENQNTGAAYIFVKSGDTWIEQECLSTKIDGMDMGPALSAGIDHYVIQGPKSDVGNMYDAGAVIVGNAP